MIEAFMELHLRTEWEWGRADCCLMLADWAMFCGHDDPADHLRGTYATESECRAAVEAAGGLIAVVAACASKIALSPVSEPENGCVAVIGSPRNPLRQWGAVYHDKKWLVRWGDAFVPFQARPLAMWRMPVCRKQSL